jgi:nitroreductase
MPIPTEMSVVDAITSRISIRAFTDQPVTREEIHAILDIARWSPSGGNAQPWKAIAVAGEEVATLSSLAQTTLAANPRGEADEFPIYPENLWEPHRSYRFGVGEDMYALLNIPREDKFGRLGQMARNYQFFGAPAALFFVIDRRMGHGQWAHLGMFMQTVCLAAEAAGLGTCAQEAWAMVRKTLHGHFGLAETEVVYCGMAIGHPDRTAAINTLRSRRADVGDFTTFRGF